MIHKIRGLSEHFLVVEDDIMVGRPVKWSDFFTSAGKPYSWRIQPTWSEGLSGPHHRIYIKPSVFQGITPTSAGPAPHYIYPLVKSFATELATTYNEWFAFVESHWEGRFSSESNSINDKRNSQEEPLTGVWMSMLVKSGCGVFKKLGHKDAGTWWAEVQISPKGFAKAIRDKAKFMNVNDRFSKDPATYHKQIGWFWDAMEKLYGVKMDAKIQKQFDAYEG
jgi:hypothetical protein